MTTTIAVELPLPTEHLAHIEACLGLIENATDELEQAAEEHLRPAEVSTGVDLLERMVSLAMGMTCTLSEGALRGYVNAEQLAETEEDFEALATAGQVAGLIESLGVTRRLLSKALRPLSDAGVEAIGMCSDADFGSEGDDDGA